MSTSNGPAGTRRHAKVNRVRGDRPEGDRLRKQARKVTNDVQEVGGTARDAAQGKFGQWRDSAFDYYQQRRGTAHACRQFVRERPFKSIVIAAGLGVIAAGVGLLLGRFWMRR